MRFDDVAPLAVVTRSGVVESLHHGALVALDAGGKVAFSVGNPDAAIYPRSSLKPLQAQALLGLGVPLEGAELAIACASHAGCREHVEAVHRLLDAFGLDERSLRNTATLPLDAGCAAAVLRAGGGATPLLQNCSGKHAAMLAACVVNGWSRDDYLVPDHPVQLAIDESLAAATGAVVHVGVDGCGAPTAMVPLIGLARAVGRIARRRGAVWSAMTSHPGLIAGPGRADTLLMEAVDGLVVKGGAEAVAVAALPDGRAVALKIADGFDRAAPAVLAAALRRLGIDTGAYVAPPVLGHGQPVGAVTPLWELDAD